MKTTKTIIPSASKIDTNDHRYFARTVIIQEYLATKEGKTKDDYTRHLKKFLAHVDTKKIENVTPNVLANYKATLKNQGLKANTINTYLSVVRDFFGWMANPEVGYATVNPAVNLSNVKVDKVTGVEKARALSPDELKQLLSKTSKGDLKGLTERVMMLLMFNLGLRVNEVMNIKRRDLVMLGDKPFIVINGKGGKQRTLALHGVLKRELNGLFVLWENELRDGLGFDDYVIQSRYWRYKGLNQKPASIKHGQDVINKYAKLAGLENIKTHSCRATAINLLLDQGVTLRNAANFVGHAHIETTRGYDRKNIEEISKTGELLNIG